MEFPDILDRFLNYVSFDSQSNPDSESFPSTGKQFNLARQLQKELQEMDLEEVVLNKWGYVMATLPSNQDQPVNTIALIAHMDTSPDVSGKGVNPQIHQKYNGKDIPLSADKKVILSVKENPLLKNQQGKTLITTDGTTLLGADNKAGIAEIMAALQYLKQNPTFPRPRIRILFTPDEEVGRGTEHITAKEIDADYGYTIDGEKLGELEDETFCADSVEIIIHGLNIHPGYAKGKLVNAIKIASQLIEQLPQNRLSPETTEKREGYIHPHQLSGNVGETVIKILIRDFTEEGLKEKETLLKDIVDQLSQKYSKANLKFQVSESYRNMKQVLDQHPEVLEKAATAMKRAGVRPIKNIIRGGTDGARLSFMGLPTPNIFTGGSNFHSIYEWITAEDMNKAAEVIVNLMQVWTE